MNKFSLVLAASFSVLLIARPIAAKVPSVAIAVTSKVLLSQNFDKFRPNPNNPEILEDYGRTTSNLVTGRTTIRRNIRSLETQKQFAPCPKGTQPMEFMETTTRLAQICGSVSPSGREVWQSMMIFVKDTGEITTLTQKIQEDDGIVFKLAGDIYLFDRYMGGRLPEDKVNDYLWVKQANGKIYAEAALYNYENRPWDK